MSFGETISTGWIHYGNISFPVNRLAIDYLRSPSPSCFFHQRFVNWHVREAHLSVIMSMLRFKKENFWQFWKGMPLLSSDPQVAFEAGWPTLPEHPVPWENEPKIPAS
jgi:hypothetical protein